MLLKIITAALGGFAGKAISDLLTFDKAGNVVCIAGGSAIGYTIGRDIERTMFGRDDSNKNVTIASESEESLDSFEEISEGLIQTLETLTQDEDEEEIGRERKSDEDDETEEKIESEMGEFADAILSEDSSQFVDEIIDGLSQPNENGNMTAMQLAFLKAYQKKNKENKPTDKE